MTYDQLRTAFDRTATLADRARQFLRERLEIIIDRKTWKPLPEGPACVVHLIPIAAMTGRKKVDVQALYREYTHFMFSDWGGASRTLNLDGLVVHPGLGRDEENVPAFTQVFRSGALEAIRTGASLHQPENQLIPSSVVSNFLRDAMARFVEAAKQLGFVGPAVASAALLHVGNFQFALGQRFFRFNRAVADRQHLILPEMWIDSVENLTDIDEVARPMLDVLWQAFNIERCFEYNERGTWSPH